MTVKFIEEWSQWFTPCNWYDFHVLHCWFENDWKLGDFDFRIIVLGIGFWITYTYNDDTRFRREIMAQVSELTSEIDSAKVKQMEQIK